MPDVGVTTGGDGERKRVQVKSRVKVKRTSEYEKRAKKRERNIGGERYKIEGKGEDGKSKIKPNMEYRRREKWRLGDCQMCVY